MSTKLKKLKFLARRSLKCSNPRYNSARFVMLPNSLGIVPVNLFSDNDKNLSFLHFSKFGGMMPPMMFSERKSPSKFGRWSHIVVGSSPVRLLLERAMVL